MQIRAQSASRDQCWRCRGHWPRTLERQMRHWAKPWSTAEFGIFPWRWVGVNNMKWSCILTKGVEPLFSALLGAVQRHGSWHVLLPKKRPHTQTARPAQQQHRAEVRQKGSKKSSEPSLEKHGGRCAQWRTRLASLCRDALSAQKERDGHKSPMACRTVTRSGFGALVAPDPDLQTPCFWRP